MLSRRLLLTGTAIGVLSAFASRSSFAASEASAVTRSDAEWRQRLTPAQYAVLRQRSTELPFSSPLLKEHRAGIFACAGCGRDLFSSETKFDSGTGWPSFWAPLHERAVSTSRDTSLGEIRIEVHCADCGGHLGHLFNDGPPVTGLRYCMNGVAMSFKPATG
jgi:peptide-methionine (R)-S-oxide reductase